MNWSDPVIKENLKKGNAVGSGNQEDFDDEVGIVFEIKYQEFALKQFPAFRRLRTSAGTKKKSKSMFRRKMKVASLNMNERRVAALQGSESEGIINY